jgi:type IV pilus assembly protein PilA
MLTKLRSRAQGDEGFTLIELLVVILIIGILAAIALPAFLGQRQKAQDTAAKTLVRNAATAMETYYTDNEAYDGANSAALLAIEPSLNDPALTTVTGAGQGYTLTATSKTGTTFSMSKVNGGAVTRSCSGSSAGCKSNSW